MSLQKLLDSLNYQVLSTELDCIEILTDAGAGSIGAKRNRLLNLATGDYVAFVDDDDEVAGNYIESIVSAIKIDNGPDCIGLHGQLVVNGVHTYKFRHSITVGRWCKDKVSRIYFRTPNHLNPIKRELALLVKFPDSSWGEDRSFSDKIKQHLKTEYFIEDILYFYIK